MGDLFKFFGKNLGASTTKILASTKKSWMERFYLGIALRLVTPVSGSRMRKYVLLLILESLRLNRRL